ncbi:hypothetical protein EHQ53_00470 [Leptospira langatensis]|uniref:Tetratricopeptide repeat protein n=1 Tax=Leptospira langatensis TaxID=2484983 RepID=A0A5F1ZYU1_9LEPT|nr:hypothetical protein [Leptospira langatensis]TGJ98243.1 hypothetical protein EHO57_16615 [Leptospira langatensis]TGL43157.1 hypothetical protein EHQ53_00470 [Leptospira langatensis]
MNPSRLSQGVSVLLLSLVGWTGTPLQADEQDQRLDPAGIYRLPHEVISPANLQKLRESLLNEESVADPISSIRAVLDPYYAQFVDPKRTEEERRLGRIFTEKTDRNSLRLLILKMMGKITQANVLRDSPILYELHWLLSKEYSKKKQNFKAMEEAVTALRYRDFAHTEDYFIEEDRLKELYDTNEIDRSKAHAQAKKDLDRAIDDHKKAKDKVHLLEAAIVREKELLFDTTVPARKVSPSDISQAKQDSKSAEDRLRAAENAYKDSFEKNYYPYFKRKSREDADAIFTLAKYVKDSENENKERLKVVNKASVSGQGIFVLFDYKRNTDYFAYAALLELAFRLDPEYSPVVLALAEELKASGKKGKSLDFYLKYLALALKENKTPAEIAYVYRSIASLHTELKQYVLAGEYYEKYYQSEPDEKKKGLYAFELGSFFDTKVGNLELGKKYYGDWLNAREQEKATADLSFPDSQERIRMETLAYLGISRLYRYEKKPALERDELLKSVQAYNRLRENLRAEEEKYSQGKKELLTIKKGLLDRTNDQDMAQYRLKSLELEESKEKMDIIRTKLDSSPGARAMQRLSILYEFEKNYSESKKVNEEILKVGNQTEINLALKNIERINKILEDGIQRDPYPRDPLAGDTY